MESLIEITGGKELASDQILLAAEQQVNLQINMKGQMSLEMIIGLLILLVVAAVVINIFITNMLNFNKFKEWQTDLRYKSFKSVCESTCNEYSGGSSGAITKFCISSLSLTKPNTVPTKIETPEAGVLPMCDDAIHCFNVYDCKTENAELVNSKFCRQSLCAAWISVYNNETKASEKVKALVPSIGSCSGIVDEDNWWLIGGFGPDSPCSKMS